MDVHERAGPAGLPVRVLRLPRQRAVVLQRAGRLRPAVGVVRRERRAQRLRRLRRGRSGQRRQPRVRAGPPAPSNHSPSLAPELARSPGSTPWPARASTSARRRRHSSTTTTRLSRPHARQACTRSATRTTRRPSRTSKSCSAPEVRWKRSPAMTERKPPDLSFTSWIDRQINEAAERGAFDNLPGAGKPLPKPTAADAAQAWLRDYLRREGVSADELLPTPLKLRKETERLAETG